MVVSTAVAPDVIEARTIRKLRSQIIPFVFVLLVIAVLDRINIVARCSRPLPVPVKQSGFLQVKNYRCRELERLGRFCLSGGKFLLNAN